MASKKQILVSDLSIGVLFIIATLLFFTAAAEWWVILAVTGHTAACMLLLHLCEHGRPRGSLVVFCVQVGVTVGVTALDAPVAAGLEFALFVGLGLGLLGYRFLYGIVRPIPEKRLTNARRRTATPSFYR
jgi:hypothetical protein